MNAERLLQHYERIADAGMQKAVRIPQKIFGRSASSVIAGRKARRLTIRKRSRKESAFKTRQMACGASRRFPAGGNSTERRSTAGGSRDL